MAVSVVACSSSNNEEPAKTTEPAAEQAGDGTYEIAMVTDVGNIDDHSFNQATYEASRDFAEANGKTFSYYRPSEDSTEARTESIATAIEKGAKVVVCPGYLFEETIFNIQEQYPDVNFILLDGEPHNSDYSEFKTAPNVHCILYKEEEAGYFAGYAAVKEGLTKLGFCGGMDVPAVIRYGYGFVQGADAAAQEMGVDIEIKHTYSGSFAPSDDLYNKMDSWYTSGTEVIFACGGSLYESVFKAAEDEGALAIGVDVDQALDSTTVLTSAEKKLKETTTAALEALYANDLVWPEDYAGKTSKLGAADNATGLPTAADSWRFSTYTVEEYQALFDKVVSGEVKISDVIDTAPEVSEHTTVDYEA
jgi:basic membrane protein A